MRTLNLSDPYMRALVDETMRLDKQTEAQAVMAIMRRARARRARRAADKACGYRGIGGPMPFTPPRGV